MIGRYAWAGGEEAMLRFGPGDGPVVATALPLFEEVNRTRTFVVTLLRALAARGVASVLPDLPGQGESLVPLETVTISRMQEAYAALVETVGEGRSVYGMGIRSGALLDARAALAGRWHLSPQTGSALLRDLARTRQVAAGKSPEELWQGDGLVPGDAPAPPVEIAGNLIAPEMLTELAADTPSEHPSISRRTVRLAGDPRPADRQIDAAPLWRRNEPSNDIVLAETLADDIAGWITACAG